MNYRRPRLKRSYPLGALFLLIAACSVILGYVALLTRQRERLHEMGQQPLFCRVIRISNEIMASM